MRTKEGDRIHKLLRRHSGVAEAVTAERLARSMGTTARRVRRIIADEAALWPDILVCAHQARGYFCAATFEEIETYDNWLGQLAQAAADKRTAFRAAAKRLGFMVSNIQEASRSAREFAGAGVSYIA